MLNNKQFIGEIAEAGLLPIADFFKNDPKNAETIYFAALKIFDEKTVAEPFVFRDEEICKTISEAERLLVETSLLGAIHQGHYAPKGCRMVEYEGNSGGKFAHSFAAKRKINFDTTSFTVVIGIGILQSARPDFSILKIGLDGVESLIKKILNESKVLVPSGLH